MRAGPAGRTAAERNSSHTGTEQTPPSIDGACPDEDAYVEQVWAEARAAGHPVSRRYIRQQLASAQARYDSDVADREFGGIVLTYLDHHGSVPVDRWELRAS